MSAGYEVHRSIRADPERVWSLLTEPADYPRWNPAVVSLDGEIAPGEKITLVSSVDPGRRFRLTVTVLERPHRMVWSQGMPFGLFTGRRTFTLTRTGEGTEFSMTETFTGPLAGLVGRAIPDLTESFTQFADGLASAAETSTPSDHRPAP